MAGDGVHAPGFIQEGTLKLLDPLVNLGDLSMLHLIEELQIAERGSFRLIFFAKVDREG